MGVKVSKLHERANVHATFTLNELVSEGNISKATLRGILRREEPMFCYKTVDHNMWTKKKPKRIGRKSRLLFEPTSELMALQRWLNRKLGKISIHEASFAYTSGRSSVQCVKSHVSAVWALKLDLQDFFHSIDEAMVSSSLKRFGFSSRECHTIARLVTAYPGAEQLESLDPKYLKQKALEKLWIDADEDEDKLIVRRGFLPQGSPTSGIICNLVATGLDERLSKLAKSKGLVYTRYSDDILFSSKSRVLSREESRQLLQSVGVHVNACGFRINSKKTRIMRPGSRFYFLGLLFDGKTLRIPARDKSNIENKVRFAERRGFLERREGEMLYFDDLPIVHQSFMMIPKTLGFLSYAMCVEPEWALPLLARLKASLERDRAAFPEDRLDQAWTLSFQWPKKLRSADKVEPF